MFREILISAGVAGLLAALLLTLLQALFITPLILQAETYEEAAATNPTLQAHEHEDGDADVDADSNNHEHQHTAGDVEHHDHHASDWQPEDGAQRTLFTLTSNIVMGVGYALLLTGLYTLWRRPSGVLQGLLFGLAGFTVFFAAPGLGLPPELPGTAAAELVARQQWWIGTAVATAMGLALIIMQKNSVLRGIGALLIIAPHLLGAPQPATENSLAPAELQAHFRWATTIGNAAFWLLLGAISALASKKFSSAANAAD